MNARLIATLSALSIGAFTGVWASAEEAPAALAWHQPGYVTEVVIVTAPRPKAQVLEAATTDSVLAWQEPGYVEEVVVVTASRREVLAAARLPEVPSPVWRQPYLGTTAK